jgi:hypothetical protein
MALCRRFLGIFVRLEVDDKPVVTQEVLTGRRSFFHHAKNIATALNAKKRPIQTFFSFWIENHYLIRQNSSLTRIRAFSGIHSNSMNLLYPCLLNERRFLFFDNPSILKRLFPVCRRFQALHWLLANIIDRAFFPTM